jgi:hypothetical protein
MNIMNKRYGFLEKLEHPWMPEFLIGGKEKPTKEEKAAKKKMKKEKKNLFD